jgi:hypothetical protein
MDVLKVVPVATCTRAGAPIIARAVSSTTAAVAAVVMGTLAER